MANTHLLLKFGEIMGKIFLAFVLVVLAFLGFARYKVHPMESFCSSVAPTATLEMVIAQARTQGFLAFDVIEARGVISVLNHRMPWFRYECAVAFQNGRIVGTRVIAAD